MSYFRLLKPESIDHHNYRQNVKGPPMVYYDTYNPLVFDYMNNYMNY